MFIFECNAWRDIVAGLERDAIRDLELVDGLEDKKSLPHLPNRQILQRSVIEVNQQVARDAIIFDLLFVVWESDGTHPLMHPVWVPLCDALHLSVLVGRFLRGMGR